MKMLVITFPAVFSVHSKRNFINDPFPNKSLFLRTCLHCKSLENTVEKEEIAFDEQFLPFLQCFLPVGKFSVMINKFKIVNCKLFQFGNLKNCHLGMG